MKKYKIRINLNSSCLLLDSFQYNSHKHIYNLMHDIAYYNIHVVAESFEAAKRAIFNIPKEEIYKLLFEEDPILHNSKVNKYQKYEALEALNSNIKDVNANTRNRYRCIYDYFTSDIDFDFSNNNYYARRDLELNLLEEIDFDTDIDVKRQFNRETIREVKVFRYENIDELNERINRFIRENKGKSIDIIDIQYQVTQPTNGVLLSSEAQSSTKSNFFKTNSRTASHTSYNYSKGTNEYHNALVGYSYVLKERLVFAKIEEN